MGYKLITTQAIKVDISNAVEWYAEINKTLARRFLKQLRQKKQYLQNSPAQIAVKYNNVRVAYLSSFPYSIHFQLNENVITIIGVFHTSVHPKNWKKRKAI